jgi:hypothetical protein
MVAQLCEVTSGEATAAYYPVAHSIRPFEGQYTQSLVPAFDLSTPYFLGEAGAPPVIHESAGANWTDSGSRIASGRDHCKDCLTSCHALCPTCFQLASAPLSSGTRPRNGPQ